MKIVHWKTETEGICTEVALRNKMENRGYEVSRYVYPPGVMFPDHFHEVDKLDAVVAGQFRICMEGEEVILGVGDMIEVARGTIHSAEVVGDVPVISLDGIKKV